MAQIKEKTTHIIEFVIDNESGQEVETHRYKTEHSLFDAMGNVLSEESFSPDGQRGEMRQQEYNDKGLLIRSLLYDGDELVEERTYSYDADEHLQRSLLRYQDGSLSESLYEYDSAGRRMAIRCTDEDGEEEYREEMRYDEKGNLIQRKRYEYEEAMWTKSWSYDDNQNLVLSVEEDHQTGSVSEKHFEFDAQGHLTEEKTYREGKLSSITRQMFDAEGHLTEIVSESPEQYERLKFLLDEQGNQIAQEAFNRQDVLIHKVERSYDAKANPVEVKVWMHDTANGITRRYSLLNEYDYHA
jgi:antitoxin component YwqK of YwqJK toxin-antitoxin module